jgi:hypothetical protein
MGTTANLRIVPQLSMAFGAVKDVGRDEVLNSYGYALGVNVDLPIGLLTCDESWIFLSLPRGVDPFLHDKLHWVEGRDLDPSKAHTIAAVRFHDREQAMKLGHEHAYKLLILRQDDDGTWSYWEDGEISNKDMKGEVIRDPSSAAFGSVPPLVTYYQLPDRELYARTYLRVQRTIDLDR